jgi:hypothetical protein
VNWLFRAHSDGKVWSCVSSLSTRDKLIDLLAEKEGIGKDENTAKKEK